MITILDQQNDEMIVAEKDVSNQTLYSLDIPANTLNPGSKIRITAELHIAVATPPECEVCIPSVNPGEQPLTEVHFYDYTFGSPVGSLTTGNVASQLNYVGYTDGGEEIISTVGDRSGFSSTYQYVNTITGPSIGEHWQVVRIIGETIEPATPVFLLETHIFGFFTQEAQGGMLGHSDEHGYVLEILPNVPAFTGLGPIFAYFDYEANSVTYMRHDPSQTSFDRWTKFDDLIFCFDFFSKRISRQVVSDLAIGTGVTFSLGAHFWQDLHATGNFLWALASNNRIYKLNKTDLSIIDTFVIDLPNNTEHFFVIADDAAYLLNSSKIYHYSFDTGEATFVSNLSGNVTSGMLHFRRGYFYVDANNARISKYGPLNCPGTGELLGA